MSSTSLETPEINAFPVTEHTAARLEKLDESRRLVTDCLIAKFDAAYTGDIGIETIEPTSNEYGFIVDAYSKHFSKERLGSVESLNVRLAHETLQRRSVLRAGIPNISPDRWKILPTNIVDEEKIKQINLDLSWKNFSVTQTALGCLAYQESLKIIRKENDFLQEEAARLNSDAHPAPTLEVEMQQRMPTLRHVARLALRRFRAA